ncbi:hypothetical protein FAGKG844_90001 [Frankia sp. AgKG'84/4]
MAGPVPRRGLRAHPAGRGGAGPGGRAQRADEPRLHDGISEREYAAALTVLRRMIANLGGESAAMPRGGTPTFDRVGVPSAWLPVPDPSAGHVNAQWGQVCVPAPPLPTALRTGSEE